MDTEYVELQPEIDYYTSLFEKNNYETVRNTILEIKKQDSLKYERFWVYLFDDVIRNSIAKHKIGLSIFLEKDCNVNAIPDDRARIILTLAGCADQDLTTINQTLEKEFGPFFQLKKIYTYNGKVLEWKQVALRAKQIRNAYRNHSFLIVQDQIDAIMAYYKGNNINDEEKLVKLDTMAQEIIEKTAKNIYSSPQLLEHVATKQMISDFYHETGRLALDIERLNYEDSFEKINEYVIMIKFVCMAKLDLIRRKIAPTDSKAAEYFLLNWIGKNEFKNYISTEEFMRFGVPLEPLMPRVMPAQTQL